MDDILQSWSHNAARWTTLLQEEELASRAHTNPAMVAQVDHQSPLQLCDLGCGEGWLTRALRQKGHQVTGLDGTQALIEQARTSGTDFYTLTYAEIIDGSPIPNAPFDAILLNFCLYQDEPTVALLSALHPFLAAGGKIITQTIHPYFLLQSNLPYQNQWLPDAWAGLPDGFTHPHPWYCRNLSGWYDCFQQAGWTCERLKEVIPSAGQAPLSIIFHLIPAHDT